jgi:hypothetical protein
VSFLLLRDELFSYWNYSPAGGKIIAVTYFPVSLMESLFELQIFCFYLVCEAIGTAATPGLYFRHYCMATRPAEKCQWVWLASVGTTQESKRKEMWERTQKLHVTNLVLQSPPWKANSRSAGQQAPSLSRLFITYHHPSAFQVSSPLRGCPSTECRKEWNKNGRHRYVMKERRN